MLFPGIKWKGRHIPSDEVTQGVESFFNRNRTNWSVDILLSHRENYDKIKKFNTFSNSFLKAIGKANCSNIYGCEDPELLEDFWNSYIEYIFYNQYINNENINLSMLLSGAKYDKYPFLYNPNIMFGVSNRCFGVTSYISEIFCIPHLDVRATLSNMLSLNIKNIFEYNKDIYSIDSETINNTFSLYKNFSEKGFQNLKDENNPSYFIIKALDYCTKSDLFTTHISKIGSATIFEHLNDVFYIPGDGYNNFNKFTSGHHKQRSYFIDQGLFYRNEFRQGKYIILFQDFCAAYTFSALYHKQYGSNHYGAIITSHTGSDLSLVPWNYLNGLHILIVPAISKWHMSLIPEYYKYLQKAGAASIKISPRLFVAFSPTISNWRNVDGVNKEEAKILNEAVLNEDKIHLLEIFKDCYDHGFDLDGFKSWGEDLGIFSKSLKDTTIIEEKVEPLPKPYGTLNPEETNDLSELTLTHAFPPENYIVIYGAKGAGKTSIGYAFAESLIYGNKGLELFKSYGIENENVCYVDAESNSKVYERIIKNCELSNVSNIRFFSLLKRSTSLPDFCNKFDLNEASFRNGLSEYLKQNRCRYVFLDNLAALTCDNTDSRKADILAWIDELQKNNHCVILFIHKSEDLKQDKKRSSQNYLQRASVVISLYGKRELDDLKKIKKIDEASKERSLIVGIKFEDHKNTPVVIGNTFWVQQLLGQSTWNYLTITDENQEEINWSEIREKYNQNSLETILQNLPSEKFKAYGFHKGKLDEDERLILAYALKEGQVSTGDLEKLLPPSSPKSRGKDGGPKATKSRDILKQMAEKGCLRHNGQKGQNSAYLPVFE